MGEKWDEDIGFIVDKWYILALSEEGYTQVEVGKWGSGERFYENVNDHIWVVEIGVELIEFEDSEIGQTVVLLLAYLVVQIVLEETEVRRIVPINTIYKLVDDVRASCRLGPGCR